MKISYGITVHNEADELNKLLEILIHKTQLQDEIIICDDFSDEPDDKVIPTISKPAFLCFLIKLIKFIVLPILHLIRKVLNVFVKHGSPNYSKPPLRSYTSCSDSSG